MAAAVAFSSCEDFLTKAPQASLSPDTYFSSEKELDLWANKFYSDILPTPSDLAELNADDNGSSSSLNVVQKGTRTPSSKSWSADTWKPLRNINYMLEIVVDLTHAGAAVLVLEVELHAVTHFQVHIVAAGEDGFIQLGILQDEVFPVACIRGGIGQLESVGLVEFARAHNLAGGIRGLTEEIFGRNSDSVYGLRIDGDEGSACVVFTECSLEQCGTGFQGESRIPGHVVNSVGRPACRKKLGGLVQILYDL